MAFGLYVRGSKTWQAMNQKKGGQYVVQLSWLSSDIISLPRDHFAASLLCSHIMIYSKGTTTAQIIARLARGSSRSGKGNNGKRQESETEATLEAT